jgi:hypothetical protein
MGTVTRLMLGLPVLASLWIPSGADAQSASALVLEKSGATVPEVQPYSEIPVGTTVSLPSGARLVFLHYQTCKTVTAVGGKVVFDAFTYTATGGSKPQEVRTPCPPTVRLRGQGEMVGVVMRSILPEVRLSTSPAFVLVGDRADEFATIFTIPTDNPSRLLRGRRRGVERVQEGHGGIPGLRDAARLPQRRQP